MFFKLLFLLLNISSIFSYNIKYVILNLEQFSSRHNLLHVAITFSDTPCTVNRKVCRFDFRAYNDGNSYMTNKRQRLNLDLTFPNLNIPNDYNMNDYNEYRKNIDVHSKNIYWGETNKTWDEIFEFEKEFLCKKYILGVYDCRHYTNKFTYWATGKASPIWKLKDLWNNNEF